MLTGQAALLSMLLFILVDGGVSAWRRGEGVRSLVLAISIFIGVAAGTAQAVLVFWNFADLPILVTPLLGNEIDDQCVNVDLNLAADLPSVQADRILIEQVLLNLLNNACAAVAGNPVGHRRVSIATSAQADGVLVEVADNGCGLPDPERVFEAFYSTTPGGLGMGLAIVRSIVNSHGGRVWAESATGGGAVVRVYLPWNGIAS